MGTTSGRPRKRRLFVRCGDQLHQARDRIVLPGELSWRLTGRIVSSRMLDTGIDVPEVVNPAGLGSSKVSSLVLMHLS
jgi:hypothetical protein